MTSNNTKKGLTIDIGGLNLDDNGHSPNSPPALAAASTTSVATLSSGQKMPRNQPIKQKLSRVEREKLSRKFITDKKLSFSYEELNEDGQLRANRLMSQDFSWSPTQDIGGHYETTFWDEFEYFCVANPLWKDLSSVFFDEKAMTDYLAIRRQRAGICFMHAVTVLQHYLYYLRKNQTGENHKMLDLSWYIRERFPKAKLEKFLKSGGGGSSLEFFCEITGNRVGDLNTFAGKVPRKSLYLVFFQIKIDLVCKYFDTWKEPALIAGFKIEEDFKTKNKLIYDGEVKEEKFTEYGKACGKKSGNCVLHSMVLLGYMKTDEKCWFLVQNFWSGKYVMAVSAEYLASCDATLIFVPQTASVTLKENFHVIDAHYIETETSVEEEETCPEEEWGN